MKVVNKEKLIEAILKAIESLEEMDVTEPYMSEYGGHTPELVHVETKGERTKFKVICVDCGEETAYYNDPTKAIEAWNTRHEPKTPGGAYVPARSERLKE